MKRRILCLIVTLLTIISCSQDKGYDYLENGLIGILEKKDTDYIVKQLEKSAKKGNTDVYGLIYMYMGDSGEVILDKYLKKSNGMAEYYKGIIMQNRNEPGEDTLKVFESAVKQGNIKAYYMIGNIYQNKLEFTKAQEYYKKGKDKGEIYSTYSYENNKILTDVYKRIEELNKKRLKGNISREEKKELGTLVLEKFANYELAYEILKDFILENYSPALYSKAKLLEVDDKSSEALKIYNEIFERNRYYLSAFEIAYKLVGGTQNYNLALRVLDDANMEDSLILSYKGYIYEKLKDYKKSEENYLKAINKGEIDSLNYLGKLYETKNEIKKAKEIYSKAYKLGVISSGYRLSQLLNENKKDNNYTNKEAKKILEKLSSDGEDYAMVDLSLYYPIKDKKVRMYNLKAAVKLNDTAFHNLGVYYYNKNKKDKAKMYFKIAKDYGYELESEYEKFINK